MKNRDFNVANGNNEDDHANQIENGLQIVNGPQMEKDFLNNVQNEILKKLAI